MPGVHASNRAYQRSFVEAIEKNVDIVNDDIG